MLSARKYLVALACIGAAGSVALGARHLTRRPPGFAPLSDVGLEAVASHLRAAWRGDPAPEPVHPSLTASSHGVYVELLSGGETIGAGWANSEITLAEGLSRALLSAGSSDSRRAADAVVGCTAHQWTPLSIGPDGLTIGDSFHGVAGIEFILDDSRRNYSPLEMLARGLSFDDAYREFKNATSPGATGIVAWVYLCEQFFVPLDDDAKPQPLFRGRPLPAVAELDRSTLLEIRTAADRWLVHRLTSEREGQAASAATSGERWRLLVALSELAAEHADDDVVDVSFAALQAELERLEAQLVAPAAAADRVELRELTVAAALALHTHPRGQTLGAERDRLLERTWAPRGEWSLIAKSSDAALERLALLLAIAHDRANPGTTAARFEELRRFIVARHREKPPTLEEVATFARANYEMWRKSARREHGETVLAASDWLLLHLDWRWPRLEDMRGRFQNDDRPSVPNAARDANCVRALAAAIRVADATRRSTAAETYTLAGRRALRHLHQLQVSRTPLAPPASPGEGAGSLRRAVFERESDLPTTAAFPRRSDLLLFTSRAGSHE